MYMYDVWSEKYDWEKNIITHPQKLYDKIKSYDLVGKSIQKIWNVGYLFNIVSYEHDGFSEFDETVIFMLDNMFFEVLVTNASTFYITQDSFSYADSTFLGSECSKESEESLKEIIGRKITGFEVIYSTEAPENSYAGVIGYELPYQDEYIIELRLFFDPGNYLAITSFYDYMILSVQYDDNIISMNKYVARKNPQYTFRYFFDYSAESCLWSADDRTRNRFDYSVDLDDLCLNESTMEMAEKVQDMFEKAHGGYRSVYLWDELLEEEAMCRFKKKAKILYKILCDELGSDYMVIDETE